MKEAVGVHLLPSELRTGTHHICLFSLVPTSSPTPSQTPAPPAPSSPARERPSSPFLSTSIFISSAKVSESLQCTEQNYNNNQITPSGKLWVDCYSRPEGPGFHAFQNSQGQARCPVRLLPKPERDFSLNLAQPGPTAKRAHWLSCFSGCWRNARYNHCTCPSESLRAQRHWAISSEPTEASQCVAN